MMVLRAFSSQRSPITHLFQNVNHFRELTMNAVKEESKKIVTTAARPTQHKGNQSNSFGMDIQPEELLRKKLEINQKKQDKHLFRQLYPWKTKLELATDLKKSEVYNQDGLIALCKPYGIAEKKNEIKEKNGQQTIIQSVYSGGVPPNTPALLEVLPILQDMYEVDHLEFVKSTSRWTSGLLLLSTSPKMTEKVRKCFRRSKSFQDPPLKYWAVTNGQPTPSSKAGKVAISLHHVNEIGKVPVIKTSYGSNEVKRGDVKVAMVAHSTLMSNAATGASLVEVNLLTVKWHFLRVWLANCYAAVLGDFMYGGRIKTVMGKKIQINPQNVTAYQPQEISDGIYQQLELPEKAPEIIPSLVHLAEVKLSQFNRDKSDLILTTSPPDHFTWACNRMGLMSDAPKKCENNINSIK